MNLIRRHHALILAGLVLAAAPVFGQAANRARQTPPIQLGTSGGSLNDISTVACCGGTLGAAVRYDGALAILSNNHVLGRSGVAVSGEDTIQNALIETSCSTSGHNVVGDFVGNVVPLGGGRNVDVGISLARSGQVRTDGSIIGLGVPCASVQNPTVGLAVRKSGRTTGVTSGTVQAINVSTTIQYQRGCGTGSLFNVSYTNQFSITPGTFSGGGDSGSLIVSSSGLHPVGLLFAGSSAATIANRASTVVSAVAAAGHTLSFVGASCKDVEEDEVTLTGVSKSELELTKSVKERYEKDLFTLPGVIGVGVGKTDDKADVTTPAIILYVNARPGMMVRGIPSEMDGVKVRVIPSEPFVAY